MSVELQLPAMRASVAVGDTAIMACGGGKLRCVIVDDNSEFLEAAADFLGHQGIDVVAVATTIAEAVDSVARLKPDVTVVDINLGSESGFDLTAQLARAAADSPVILTSTRSEQEYAELIAASAAIGFLPKTELSADALRRLIAFSD